VHLQLKLETGRSLQSLATPSFVSYSTVCSVSLLSFIDTTTLYFIYSSCADGQSREHCAKFNVAHSCVNACIRDAFSAMIIAQLRILTKRLPLVNVTGSLLNKDEMTKMFETNRFRIKAHQQNQSVRNAAFRGGCFLRYLRRALVKFLQNKNRHCQQCTVYGKNKLTRFRGQKAKGQGSNGRYQYVEFRQCSS